MTTSPQTRLSVDEYLAWVEGEPGRYELYDGVAHAMSPEGAGHAEVKFAVQIALATGIRARRLSCHMLPNGVAVRVDSHTAYEPPLDPPGLELALADVYDEA